MNLEKNQIQHIAIIMDGNRRWEKENNKNSGLGHKTGLENIKKIVERSIAHNIKYLTLFAFSTDNIKREKNEIELLFVLFQEAITQYEQYLIDNEISFKIIGDLSIINNSLKNEVNHLIKKTNIQNPKLTLIVAFNYSGQQEIVDATKTIVKKIINDKLDTNKIDITLFKKNMQSRKIPDPDLLIRTGGKLRISNFLLWQLSYTELYFTNINWPNFSENDIDDAINEFYKRNRTFGK